MANDIDNNNPWATQSPHEPLHNMSLEHLLKVVGESETDKVEKPVQKSDGSQSDIITAMLGLLHQRAKKSNLGEIQRLVVKMGIDVIGKDFGGKIEDIAEIRSKITESADILSITKSLKVDIFSFKETISVHPHKISLRVWQVGAIAEKMAEPLNFYFSTALQLVLLAGISRSEVWIPRKLVKIALDELENFGKYLDKEKETLTGLLKK